MFMRDTRTHSPGRPHQLPATDFAPVRVGGGIIRIAVVAIGGGPVELLVEAVLRRAVVRIVDGLDTANVVVKLVVRAARLRAAPGYVRGLQLTVDIGNHRVIVRADLLAEASRSCNGVVARLKLAIELVGQIRVDRLHPRLPRGVRSKGLGNGGKDGPAAIQGSRRRPEAVHADESPVDL